MNASYEEEYDGSVAFTYLYDVIRIIKNDNFVLKERNLAALEQCKQEIEEMMLSNDILHSIDIFPCQADDGDGASLFFFDRDEG